MELVPLEQSGGVRLPALLLGRGPVPQERVGLGVRAGWEAYLDVRLLRGFPRPARAEPGASAQAGEWVNARILDVLFRA